MRRPLPSNLTRLIEQVESLPQTPPPEALAALLRASRVSLADVRAFATEDAAHYTRNTIHASEKLEVKLLVWLPGQASPIHNHAGSTCAVKVLGGEATEVLFVLGPDGRPTPTAVTRHQTGAIFAGADADTHIVQNRGRDTLYTLHLYTPPLRNMRIWDDGTGVGAPPEPTPPPPPRPNTPDTPDFRDQVSQRLAPLGLPGRLADRFVTFVSGLAPTGAEPWFVWTRPTFYAAVLLWLFGGAAASMAILATGNLWLLPLLLITVPVTASGGRAGMLTIMHDAIHMWAAATTPWRRRLFWWIGTIMSTLLFVENFRSYAEKHLRHHGKEFATRTDPDVGFIRDLGFEPGMSRDDLWRQFRRLRWSRWFHWTYFKGRFASQLLHGPLIRRVAVAAFWIGVFGVVAAVDAWLLFVVGWALPVGLLFQRQALEQFLGEHRWLKVTKPGTTRRAMYAELSAGRFALDAPPPAERGFARRLTAWMIWWVRLVLVHAPFRAGVVWGDLAHHDEHHVHGLLTLHRRGVRLPRYAKPDVAWMNTAYGRRIYQRLRKPGDPNLTAFWNRDAPLEATFQALSRMDPLVGDGRADPGSMDGMLRM